MSWSSFWGAFAGALVAIVIAIGAIAIWDHLERKAKERKRVHKPGPFDGILESHLEQQIMERFADFFPGWEIFDDSSKVNASDQDGKLPGVRYRTDAGEIDILCVDQQGNFIVVELKRGKAPDRVVAQVDRYIAWVKRNLAKPEQRVEGLIIARSFDNRLCYTLSQRQDICTWIYSWELKLDQASIE